MKIDYAPRTLHALGSVPPVIKKTFYKQLRLLSANLRHPSLRAKKYDESKDWWQARVNDDWRFYFTIINDTYVIQDVIKHPK
jgi:hypothetical protein